MAIEGDRPREKGSEQDSSSMAGTSQATLSVDGAGRRRRPRMGQPGFRRIPPKRYRIGEVVEYAGVSRQTIHNYTTMGLLRECDWTDGGHRLYDEEVFERLAVIAELKAKHRSLTDIRSYFAKQELSVEDGQGSADGGEAPETSS